MKSLLLFLLLSTNAQAEYLPLPGSIPGVDEIISQFRLQLETKLVDLGKNYISSITSDSIIFTNSEPLRCNGKTTPAGEPVSSLQYYHKKQNAALVEKVIYTGCNADIALIEESTTTGKNLEPLKFSDVIKGKRTFDLKDNETSRRYKVLNGENEEIFSVFIEKKETSKIIVYSILGEKFLTVNFEYQPGITRSVFTYHGYNVSYIRQHDRWVLENDFTPFSFLITVKKGESVTYMDNNGKPISLSVFMNVLTKIVMNVAVRVVGQIFNYHNFYFPVTEETKTGSQAQRFIEEIRIAQNRLNTNTDLNLVKNLLQELINAAQLGQIIDNRPKKE